MSAHSNKKPHDLSAATPTTDKVPLLLFSGGLESTYLLHSLLKIGPVDLLCFDHGYNMPSAAAEMKARKNILTAMAKRKDLHQVRNIRSLHERAFSRQAGGLPFEPAFPQLFEHLLSALYATDYSQHSSVILGLAFTDDSATIHDRIPGLWKSLFSVFRPSVNSTSIPELQLPLMWFKRREVYQDTPRWLSSKTWSCCSPNFAGGQPAACGICVKCMDHKRMLEDIRIAKRQAAQLQKSINQRIDIDVEKLWG